MTVDREIIVTRSFPVPPAEVFRAWTEPEHLTWFLNPEQPTPDEPIEVDLRVGGAWRLMMVIDDDTRYWTGGVYLEIEPDRLLRFAWGAVDGWPALDLEHLEAGPIATVELREADDESTDATFTLALPASLSDEEAQRSLDMGISQGWRMTMDRLRL